MSINKFVSNIFWKSCSINSYKIKIDLYEVFLSTLLFLSKLPPPFQWRQTLLQSGQSGNISWTKEGVKNIWSNKCDVNFSNTLMISTPPIMTVAESSERMTSPSPRLLSAKKVTLTIFWKTVWNFHCQANKRRDSYSSDSFVAGDTSGFSCRTTLSEVHHSGEE